MIDLDHNATTPLDPRVAERMAALMRGGEGDGNPSSVHGRGRAARAVVESARREIASTVNAEALGITFTSGGTEADNLALFGACLGLQSAGKACGLLTTRLEHPAVLGAAMALERRGIPVHFVEPDGQGRIDAQAVGEAVAAHADVGVVSLAAANHELGNRYDTPSLVAAARGARSEVIFHADAVQALGKVAVDFLAWDVDLLSISAHKIYGPKGIGALVHRPHQRLEPMVRGGHQERGRRPGTESTLLAHGFGEAARLVRDELEARRAAIAPCYAALRDGLEALGAVVHGTPNPPEGLGNALNVRFPGCDGELMLMNLDLEGIAVSTGAACSAGTLAASPVLLALGLPEAEAAGAVRLSLGHDNTLADVERLLAVLPGIIDRVREVGGKATA